MIGYILGVVNGNGEWLVGSTIYIEGGKGFQITTKSLASGMFIVVVPAGSYKITATHEGYKFVVKDVTVGLYQVQMVIFDLEPI